MVCLKNTTDMFEEIKKAVKGYKVLDSGKFTHFSQMFILIHHFLWLDCRLRITHGLLSIKTKLAPYDVLLE